LLVALAGLTLLVGAGLAAPRVLDGASAPSASAATRPAGTPPAGPALAPAPRVTTIRVGAKTFSEQYILAEVLRQRLEAAGVAVEIRSSLGSNVVFDALRRGDLDVYVDYSGTIYANFMKRPGGGRRWQVLAEVEAFLAGQGLRSLGSLGFENAYALAVRRDTATRLGLRSLVDLAGAAAKLRLGTDYEFLGRPEWAGVRDAYGLAFARAQSFDPSLLYDALGGGATDVVTVFSSDGRIAADDLVVLADPKAALPPYDAMILLGPRVVDDARVECALAPLRGAIGVALKREANGLVDRQAQKATPAEAATWLLAKAALPPPRCAGE
jgi:osmoprotectant transport system permease protein